MKSKRQSMYFSVYGLRRSGNHAVIGWLIKNMSNGSPLFQVKHPLIFAKDVCFLNDITDFYQNDVNALRIDAMFARANFKNMIVSYEDLTLDCITEFTAGMKQVVVVRDIRNVAASRLRKSRDNPGSVYKRLMHFDERVVDLWAEHAKAIVEGRVTGIIFENWLTSKTYRDEIAMSLGMKNLDITDTVLPYGGGSSFTGITSLPPSAEKLQKRYLQTELDRSTSKLLDRKDISELRSRLGYVFAI